MDKNKEIEYLKLYFQKWQTRYKKYFDGKFGHKDTSYITLSSVGIYNHLAKMFNNLELGTRIIVFSEGNYCKNDKVATLVVLSQIEIALTELNKNHF